MAVEGHWSAGGSENWHDKGDLVDNENALVGVVCSFAHNGRECRIQCPHARTDGMELAEDVTRKEIACQSRAPSTHTHALFRISNDDNKEFSSSMRR